MTDEVARAFALCEDFPDFDALFTGLGVPTLRRTLDEPGGVLGVIDADEAESYCAMAAGVEARALDDLAEELASLVSFFADCLLNTFSVDSKAYRESGDGHVFLDLDGREPIEVTPELLRHWQWLLCLFVIGGMPTRFLESMPPGMRDRARQRAHDQRTFGQWPHDT